MSTPTWYLGPLGDLRALPCPEPGIKDAVVRYGAIHQGLTGARTVDWIDHRAELSFDFTYLDKSEWAWLKALHTRHIPGPVRLLRPDYVNRLSHQSTRLFHRYDQFDGPGQYDNATGRDIVNDWPANVEPRTLATRLTQFANNNVMRFDRAYGTPVFPTETVTASIYMKAEAAGQTIKLVLDQYDVNGATMTGVTTPSSTVTLTTDWQRCTLTTTVPAGCGAVVFALVFQAQVTNIRFAAPQLEAGSTATAWEQGGGALVVDVDQLDTGSPRFPLTDATLTLLEV